MHLKKDRTDAYIYQKLFMEIGDRYRDYIPVHTDDSRDGNYMACATVFPSNTEIWAIIKILEEIKNSVASKYIVFTDSLTCFQALQSMKLEHPLIGMMIRKCFFIFYFDNKDISVCWIGYLAILVLAVTKRQTAAWLVCSILNLNIVSDSILFPFSKVIGMVRLRTSLILSIKTLFFVGYL